MSYRAESGVPKDILLTDFGDSVELEHTDSRASSLNLTGVAPPRFPSDSSVVWSILIPDRGRL